MKYYITITYVCSVCACLDLSVSSSSWGLGKAAICNCGTPWTFLLPFLEKRSRLTYADTASAQSDQGYYFHFKESLDIVEDIGI